MIKFSYTSKPDNSQVTVITAKTNITYVKNDTSEKIILDSDTVIYKDDDPSNDRNKMSPSEFDHLVLKLLHLIN